VPHYAMSGGTLIALTFDYAKQLGLNLSFEMPPKILELMSPYPPPVRRFPTVEYLPERHPLERQLSAED
jgi:hypothetical protein